MTTMATARIHLDLPPELCPPPLIVRDPFLELLGLVAPGEPIAITFEEMVKAAGHVCPTVAGAYLILRHGLASLYGDEPAVRGEVRVTAFGGPSDFGYGPIAQVVNHVIGAAPETGFGGLGRGSFRRRDLFVFRRESLQRNRFEIERLDCGSAVQVIYDPSKVPTPRGLADAMGPALTAPRDAEAVVRFRSLWLELVTHILTADETVVRVEPITEARPAARGFAP